MAQYDSSFSGTHNDEYDARLTVLENKLQSLENMTDGSGFSGKWNITISGGARYVEGDNDASGPGAAMIRSGPNRPDSTPNGDTWIYYDNAGGTTTPWGIRHNQGNNTIGFVGSGVERTFINLSNGFVNTNGAYGFKKWTNLTLAAPNFSDQDITITTHGRPVYVSLMGDNNPDNNAWVQAHIYRDGTELANVIAHDPGASTNRPFCVQHLDIVGAGSHTYKFRIQTNSGTIYYTESGGLQGPSCVCFEI